MWTVFLTPDRTVSDGLASGSRYTFAVPDTPPTDPRAFRQAYLETIYHAQDIAFTLSRQPTGITLFDGRAFGLITAANPFSTPLSNEENDARNRAMQRELERLGLSYGPSLGTDRTGSWQEPGFIIWDTSAEAILSLGRQFDQNAIVYGVAQRVSLGWCADQRMEWFHARFPARLEQ